MLESNPLKSTMLVGRLGVLRKPTGPPANQPANRATSQPASQRTGRPSSLQMRNVLGWLETTLVQITLDYLFTQIIVNCLIVQGSLALFNVIECILSQPSL